MPAVLIPTGQYTSVGFAKETTFGTGVTPTIFPAYEMFTPQAKNTGIQRTGARHRGGRSLPATGQYDFTGSLRPEGQPDILAVLLFYAMGSQTTPTPAVAFQTLLTAASTAGTGTVLAVTAGTGTNPLLTVGASVIVGYGTANQETCTITALAANSITVTTTKTHAIGDPVVLTSSVAYTTTLQFPLPSVPAPIPSLPSFTLEYNRVADAIDYLGCMIDTIKAAGQPGQEIQVDFGLVAATELINASPATPGFSMTFPLTYEAPSSAALAAGATYKGTVLGVPGQPMVRKWDVSMNNQLDKTFRTAGSRFVQGFPLGQRQVTASLELSFQNNSAYQDFLGAAGATSPQSAISGVSLVLTAMSQSYADPALKVPYSISFNLPNLFITGDPVPGKTSGVIVQTLAFDGAETPGGNNDLSINVTTASSATF
jgi:Phage tail tube protein